MKILLTGTIYTGKTTLLQALKTMGLPNLTTVPEIAREVLSQNPKLEKDPNLQDILFSEQVKREQEALSASTFVVCDRGALDIIAHSKLFGHVIRPEWTEWVKTYDLVFLLNKNDIPFSGENRAFSDLRREWIAFREQLDRYIKLTLDENRVLYETLSGNLESRLDYFTLRTHETFRSKENYGRNIERL